MWHVGVLYRLTDLLGLLAKEPLTEIELRKTFPTYHGVRIDDLLKVAITCTWITLEASCKCVLTTSGQSLLSEIDTVKRLRIQVKSLLNATHPQWGSTIVQGRAAFAQYAPCDVVQCFREAGLLDATDEETIQWWDSIAAKYRDEAEARRLETGRKGERLSYEYEFKRTLKKPRWIALEFAFAGYDLVSQVSPADTNTLLVEVKASTETKEKAKFHLSRHEWVVLSTAEHAVVHLWALGEIEPKHSVVPLAVIGKHVPRDQDLGAWESFECPFLPFMCD